MSGKFSLNEGLIGYAETLDYVLQRKTLGSFYAKLSPFVIYLPRAWAA